jgi:hypothetical protein
VLPKEEGAGEPTPSAEAVSLLAETSRDVGENVLDLVAEKNKDHDDHDSDKDQDQGVLDHALPLLVVLAVNEFAELEIKI